VRQRFSEISHQRYSERSVSADTTSAGPPGIVPGRTVHAVSGREFTELPAEDPVFREACWDIVCSFCKCSLQDLPILRWVPNYSWNNLKFDLIAGISVGVLLVPQSLAYALLAGMPAIMGMYSSIVPLIVYSIFTSSSKVSMGPVAPTSILINGIIQSVAATETDPERLIMLGSAIAFACGVIQIAMGLLRFGFIAKLLSWPVMTGYLVGAAITIIVSQVKEMLGLTYPKGVDDRLFYQRVYNIFAYIPSISWQTSLISLGCLIVLLGFKYLPACGLYPCCGVKSCGTKPPSWFPIQLIVVIASIVFSILLGTTATNAPYFRVVGAIPPGLPKPIVPVDNFHMFVQLLPQAFVLALIAYVGTVSLAVSFARIENDQVSANLELTASGLANIAGSFFQSFTVSGSFTRSAVNVDIGSKTPASGFVTAGLMILTLAFIAPAFETLPKATLAAMIVASTLSLLKFGEMASFWSKNKLDGALSFLTLILTLVIGVDWGIIAAVGVTLALMVLRSFKPRLTEIGWLPGTDVFVDRARYPQAVLIPGVILYRVDGELHFGNIDTVSSLLQKTLTLAAQVEAPREEQHGDDGVDIELSMTPHAEDSPIAGGEKRHHATRRPEVSVSLPIDTDAGTGGQDATAAAAAERMDEERVAMLSSGRLHAVVLDCSRVSSIDLSACQELKLLMSMYAKEKVLLILAAMPGPVRDAVEKFGVFEPSIKLKGRRRFLTVAGAVEMVVERDRWPIADPRTLAVTSQEHVPLAVKLSELRAARDSERA
jgi:sulfate permease, SulP family